MTAGPRAPDSGGEGSAGRAGTGLPRPSAREAGGQGCAMTEENGRKEVPPNMGDLVSLANIEYRIGLHMRGAYENFLQVGRCLVEAKDLGLVSHGGWEDWVRRNTGMSERNAQRLMLAARSVPAGSAMEGLPLSKIQALLALPEAEREPMAERAADEGMGLRELRAEIQAQRERAEYAEAQKKRAENAGAKAAAEMAKMEKWHEELNIELSVTRDALEWEQNHGAKGISQEAQAEIDRLKGIVEETEAYAEEQAELRQQAQRDMLAMRSQAARGEAGADPSAGVNGMSAEDLGAAVRAFMGRAGVLPHMGVELARGVEAERQQVRRYVDMVAAWVDGARAALDMVIVKAKG